ncbi:hypothetical protein BU17DRAFT_102522 [Hysterangium stoloniferum]|nr:hypothetical protein BU17DRAFT_102522 [Hysterangium stoloniferum]
MDRRYVIGSAVVILITLTSGDTQRDGFPYKWKKMLLFTLGLPLVLLSSVIAAPNANDPCVKVAGKQFVAPADALACLKSFPFNETIRQNVIATVSGVFDFYTFEDFYLNSPPPFQESTANIRAELARINSTKYTTDFDFSKDLYDFTTKLNDGHTRWFPACYFSVWQNILPAPPVTLEVDGVQNVFVSPDAVVFLEQLGTPFTSFFDALKFDWRRLAGAKVLQINGLPAYDYVDRIASNTSGNYLDHGVRVNSVFSSYRLDGTNAFSQRIGDLAGPVFPDPESVTFTLIPVNSTKLETITIPYASDFIGVPFTDGPSFWENNCAVNDATNGVDNSGLGVTPAVQTHRRMRGNFIDGSLKQALGLPPQFQPTVPIIAGQNGTVKSFILPDNKTGVLFVGSFEGDEQQFQQDTVTAVNAFKARGVSQLIIDITNNGGEYRLFFLAGSAQVKNPGFQSSSRANPLAQTIVKADIARGITPNQAFYAPANWASLDNVEFKSDFDYNDPSLPFFINGQSEPTSQRFLDVCDAEFFEPFPAQPPFDLNKVVIVGNGNCASTCSMFTTLMHELHKTKNIVFGGKPGERLEYKGMAGNQVLEWADLDSEIKTAGVKNDSLAPPDLIINANMRVNWRTAYSFFDESKPIAYVSEPATLQFPYTKDTYNNPQNVWEFVAAQVL